MDIVAKGFRLLGTLSVDTKIKLFFILCWFAADGMLFVRFGESIPFVASSVLYYAMIIFLLLIIVLYEKVPGRGLLFYSLAMSVFMVIPVVLFCFVAPATPAKPIDVYLQAVDHFLGYHSDKIFFWFIAHPIIRLGLEYSYSVIFYELYLFLTLFAFLGERKAIQKFLFAMMLCYSFSMVFYLFFPSLAPAYTYADIPASGAQLQVIAQFILLHLHQPLYFHNMAIIAFPSFHCIWALSIPLFCYQRTVLFWVFSLVNLTVIIATLALGWHYLSDLLGAVIFLLVSLWITRFVFSRYSRDCIVEVLPDCLQTPRQAIKFQWIAILVLLLAVLMKSPLVLLFFTLWFLAHIIFWVNERSSMTSSSF